MVILQVYQATVLRDLHKGCPNPEMMQELRSINDYALRAKKVTVQVLGRVMTTLMVQEHHLWLNLMERQDAEKVCLHFPTVAYSTTLLRTLRNSSRQSRNRWR